MNRRRPSTATLVSAAVIVIIALVALVVLPFLLMQRIQEYRVESERHAEPARAALNDINYRLAQQMSVLARASVTGHPADVAAYQRAIAPQQAAMDALARHVGSLGHDFDSHFRELQAQIERWHASVQQNVDSDRLATGADYPAVIEAVHRLDDAITQFQSSRREEVARLTRIQLWSTAALVLTAAIAAAVVLWIIGRLRMLTSVLEEESQARQSALERQEDLVRLRDEILGVVSHDLRSPLTTITLSAQLIPGSSSPEQSEHVDTILSTTRRMERLIQDLLDVTKIEHSRLSIRKDAVDPTAVVRDVIAGHEPIAAKQGIELRTSIDNGIPVVCGDRDRLVQALTNLVGNAFKFTPAGGEVELAVHRLDSKVRFVVNDSGPGIAASDLPHLFEPFWQAKKTAHLGAGLGLKITRAIVDAHEGSIEVSNRPSGGACFAFEIPAASRES